MIDAKSIYRVTCDDCLRRTSVETEHMEFAIAALKQAGWKIGYDGNRLVTLCHACAERKKA